MKNVQSLLIFSCLTILSIVSCKKEKLDTSDPIYGLGGDVWTQGNIDKWIHDSLTEPFNLTVIYKWDQFQQGNIAKTLVPPDESKVIPMLQLLKKTWIEPYVKIAGKEFMRKYIPKQIALVGSPSYNSNGTITLGEAEGGKRILLYVVNGTDVDDREHVQKLLHTVHHEFAHILHQTVLFAPAYERISAGGYTGDWTNQTTETAYSLGFITPYAMSNKSEDFVEMISLMFVLGPDGFENILSQAPADGAERLRKKKELIIEYLKSKWNIDFVTLQRTVGRAIDAIEPPVEPLHKSLGAGSNSPLKSLIAPGSFSQPSQSFRDSFARANSSLKASDYFVDTAMLSFTHTDTALLILNYRLISNPAIIYFGYVRYKVSAAANGELSFGNAIIQPGRSTVDNNANFFASSSKPITGFFEGKTFLPKWVSAYDRFSPINYGGLYNVANAGAYFQGVVSSRVYHNN